MAAGEVARFFDREAGDYFNDKAGMTPFHELTARRIEDGLDGRVAAIGGIWAAADEERCRALDLTIVDISRRMLEQWEDDGYDTVVGDARETTFATGSLDHVVLPGILHHITEGGFWAARAQLQKVMTEMRRVLRPGGRVWISDFSIPSLVYAAEGLAAPITKRALGLADIPLVVMHPRWVYERELRRVHFDHFDFFRPHAEGLTPFVRPVIGLDWLMVPRALYPVTPVLISAERCA